MKALAGRGVVITGAGSGIGQALAEALAREGARLLITDQHDDRVQAVASALRAAGADVHGVAADAADRDAWAHLAALAEARWGGAQVLINNAGFALVASVEAAPEDEARRLMDVNFWGPVLGCRAFAPQLRRQHEALIVNVSSIFAMVSVPTQGYYNASKAALRALSDALRLELADTPVRLLCVHPGGVRTRIAQDARLVDWQAIAASPEALKALFSANSRTTPAQAAATIVRAMKSGRSRLLVGADAHVADLLWRLFPSRTAGWLTAHWTRLSRAEPR